MTSTLFPLALNELLCRPSQEQAACIFFLTSMCVNITAMILAERHNAAIDRTGINIE
jgi:hypothetical protein